MKIKEVMSIQTFFLLEVFIPISSNSSSGTLHIWSRGSLANSKKMVISTWTRPKVFQIFLRGENYSESVQITKYEKNFDFKPHVYLPYLRSYGYF